MEFLGEAGEDGGGLKREFWCLLFKQVKSSLFEGVGDRLVPSCCTAGSLFLCIDHYNYAILEQEI